MATLEQQNLDWTDTAPFAFNGSATTTATADTVFGILADHERWPEWFPGVKKVEVLGPAEGVGARRRVSIPGAKVEEIFIVWDPGQRWAFTGTGASPKFLRALVEDCRLEPQSDGSTKMTYTMYCEPAPVFRPVMKLAKSSFEKNLTKAMKALAARAEGR